MTCPRTVEVDAAHDGRLADTSKLERHLQTCAQCRAHASRLDKLGQALRTLPPVLDDDLAAQRARNRLVEALGAGPAVPRRDRVRRFIAPAAIAAIVAVGVCIVLLRTPPRSSGPAIAADPIQIDAEHAHWSRVDDGATTTVQVDDGDVRIHVGHSGNSRRLVVLLPDGKLEDLGTTFFVSVRAGRTVVLTVEEGRVAFYRGNQAPLLLSAGERWVAPEAIAIAPPSVSAPPSSALPVAPAIASPPRAVGAKKAEVAGAPSAATFDRTFREAVAKLDSGDAVTASRLLRGLVVHDASNPRAEDAGYLLVIALQRAADADGARRAAQDYLQRFPNGFRRTSVEPIAR